MAKQTAASPGPAEGRRAQALPCGPPGSPQPPGTKPLPPAQFGPSTVQERLKTRGSFRCLMARLQDNNDKQRNPTRLFSNIARLAIRVMPYFSWGIKRTIYNPVLLWEKDLRPLSSQGAASNSPPGGTVSQPCYGRKRRAQYSSIFRCFKRKLWIKYKCHIAA